MVDPLFWLGLSILLVAVSLTAVLVVALPALQELGRAARSAEKLFETLNRELPPTLDSIRLTGMEISELTDDMSEGVQSAGQLVKQVEQGLSSTRQQAQKVQTTTRSFFTGVKAAWKTFTRKPSSKRRSRDRHLAISNRPPIDLEDRQNHAYSTKPPQKGWQNSPGEFLTQPGDRLHAYGKNGLATEFWDETAANSLKSTSQAEELGTDGAHPAKAEPSKIEPLESQSEESIEANPRRYLSNSD